MLIINIILICFLAVFLGILVYGIWRSEYPYKPNKGQIEHDILFYTALVKSMLFSLPHPTKKGETLKVCDPEFDIDDIVFIYRIDQVQRIRIKKVKIIERYYEYNRNSKDYSYSYRVSCTTSNFTDNLSGSRLFRTEQELLNSIKSDYENVICVEDNIIHD